MKLLLKVAVAAIITSSLGCASTGVTARDIALQNRQLLKNEENARLDYQEEGRHFANANRTEILNLKNEVRKLQMTLDQICEHQPELCGPPQELDKRD